MNTSKSNYLFLVQRFHLYSQVNVPIAFARFESKRLVITNQIVTNQSNKFDLFIGSMVLFQLPQQKFCIRFKVIVGTVILNFQKWSRKGHNICNWAGKACTCAGNKEIEQKPRIKLTFVQCLQESLFQGSTVFPWLPCTTISCSRVTMCYINFVPTKSHHCSMLQVAVCVRTKCLARHSIVFVLIAFEGI